MKIFIITNIQLEVCSAPRTHILELSKALIKKNDVFLFVMNATEADIGNTDNLHNFNFIFKNWEKRSFRLGLLLHGLLVPIAILYIILRKGEPDVVYIRYYPTLIFVILLFRLLHIPIVIDVKGIVLHEISLYRRMNIFEKKVLKILEKLCLKLSNHIIVAQGGISDFINKTYMIAKDKITIIPNGVNTDIFIPMKREVVLDRLKLDPYKRYIGFVGSLDRWQGIDYLINMMKVIKNRFSNICLLIVGGGVEYSHLKELIKDNNLEDFVLLIDYVLSTEVPYYINSCEFCFAYKSKLTTGISALKFYEYLACQKPIIVSRVGGAEFVEQNGVGELVEQDNLEKLIKTTERWLLKPQEEIKEIGTKGRRLIIENYNWAIAANKIEKLMLRLIKNDEKRISKNYKCSWR